MWLGHGHNTVYKRCHDAYVRFDSTMTSHVLVKVLRGGPCQRAAVQCTVMYGVDMVF